MIHIEFLKRVKNCGGIGIWTDNIDEVINVLNSI